MTVGDLLYQWHREQQSKQDSCCTFTVRSRWEWLPESREASTARVSLSLADTQATTVSEPPAADCKQNPGLSEWRN